MAKTIRNGDLISGTGLTGGLSNPVHSAAGRILGLLISHAQATIQQVILYDSLTASAGDEILSIFVAPEATPFYVRFPRDDAPQFSTGLTITAGNCDVQLWSLDYG